jgi:endonuclease-3
MKKTEKLAIIERTLDRLYPEVKPALDFTDHYTLLIAVLLSAQCTDERVNQVTKVLFKAASTPVAMLALGQEKVLEIIRPCGLSPTKSKNIIALSRILVDKYQSIVPDNFEELEQLPGVGHKTASVVMVQGFRVPAFPVDTHIFRLAGRWGLSKGNTVEKVEADLKKLFRREDWAKRHLQIIYYGRGYCKARGHNPLQCPICSQIGVKN